ncbi:MAG: CoA transferase [Acidimicrobiia bacterium]|nr:CoA transferase [Acidimicrobiia bacterium]
MPGMLDGIMILELGQVIAGNFAGVILADLGAEIIKIEPQWGDTARNAKIAPLGDESAIHLFMNRGKKSVVMDMKSERGRQIFYDLVKQADVVIDNFRPGVMARLGIDHDTLKQLNEDIITVSVTGFGETGPLKDKAAFDLVVQAYSGHMDITGDPDGPPARMGAPMADISGGIYACISILAALVGRERNGTGQHVDVAMLDSLIHLLSYDALDHLTTGKEVGRHGSAHAHMVPWQAFATLDGYVVVAARDEKFWINLCDAIDRPDLKTDPRTADNAARVANRAEVVPILDAVFRTKTKAEWIEILDRYDIPSAPVNSLGDVFSDEHVRSRGMVQIYEHPTLGPISFSPSPMKFSDWTFPNESAPMLGEQTFEVLKERLGYADADLETLEADGVVVNWTSGM